MSDADPGPSPWVGIPPPPVPCTPYVRLWRPQGIADENASALDSHIVGLSTHWDRETTRTVLCFGKGDCEHCAAGHQAHWTGYLGVFHWVSRRPRVLTITRSAWSYSPTLQRWNGQLARFTVRCRRLYRGARAPIAVEVEEPQPGTRLPPPFATLEVLSRLFGFCLDDIVAITLRNV